MKSVTVRNLELGTGLPKICVPIMGKTTDEIEAAVARLKETPLDLVEWRGDAFEALLCEKELLRTASRLRVMIPCTPILFTIRTNQEMGDYSISDEEYIRVNKLMIASTCIDAVDIELSRGEAVFDELLKEANLWDIPVIASRHEKDHTPSPEEIINTMCKMQEMGASIAKYAVMPQSEYDVLKLLRASIVMKKEHNSTPIITMSMSTMGGISRLAGSLTGSCLTFGTAGAASAPGQMPAEVLAEVLKLLGE